MRIKLIVAYDGTNYHGWQVQKNANTIEAELNKHLSELLKEDIQVIGASRTDAGVHALGNIAVFDTNTQIPAEKIAYALNQRLPEDIKIQGSIRVEDDFHPRKCESVKTYEYKIFHAAFPNPIMRLYAHFTYRTLDIRLMQEAAAYLEGKHDFKSFCSTDNQSETTVRTLYKIEIIEEGNLIRFRIAGSGFLYNMVRIIVGTLVEFGLGKYPTEYMREIVKGLDRSLAGPTMPANGLTLVKYDFL